VNIDRVAGADKVESYLVDCLTFVESNFDSSVASANALEVVLRHLSGDHVLHVSHSLQGLLVEVLWQASHIDVNHLLLGQVLRIVILLGVVTGK